MKSWGVTVLFSCLSPNLLKELVLSSLKEALAYVSTPLEARTLATVAPLIHPWVMVKHGETARRLGRWGQTACRRHVGRWGGDGFFDGF